MNDVGDKEWLVFWEVVGLESWDNCELKVGDNGVLLEVNISEGDDV